MLEGIVLSSRRDAEGDVLGGPDAGAALHEGGAGTKWSRRWYLYVRMRWERGRRETNGVFQFVGRRPIGR